MVSLKLSIKPFINSYMLPCSCDEQEWAGLLEEYNARLAKGEGNRLQERGTLTIRPDGLALLEGSIVKEFRLSRQGVDALKLTVKLRIEGRSSEEIVQQLARVFQTTSYQVEVFLNLVDRWVGDAEYLFLEGPTPLQGKHLDIPLLVQWEVTAGCNLKCVHCYADTDGQAAPGELDTQEALAFIDQIADAGVRGIHFLGGEPFTRSDILQLVRRTSGRGMFAHISTNGTLITPEIAEQFASLKRITVDVSLDGVCAKSHDSFRGVEGTFDKVLQALETLKKAKVVTNVTSVLGKHNFDKIEEIMDIAVKYGAKRVQFLTLSPTGRGAAAQKKYGFSEKHLRIVRKKILDLIFKYWDKIYIDAPMIGFNLLALRTYEVLKFKGFESHYDVLVGCNAGISKVAIDYLGNVIPCPQYRTPFGNIRAADFIALWQKLHSTFSKEKICEQDDCAFELYCGGKCRIEANK